MVCGYGLTQAFWFALPACLPAYLQSKIEQMRGQAEEAEQAAQT